MRLNETFPFAYLLFAKNKDIIKANKRREEKVDEEI